MIRIVILLVLVGTLVGCRTYVDVMDTKSKEFSLITKGDFNIFYYHAALTKTKDNEVISPTAFEIRLPKGISTYEFNEMSSFGFYYDNKQVIFIDTNIPTRDEANERSIEGKELELLIDQLITSGGKYDIKSMKIKKERRHILIEKPEANILLFNVNVKNIESWKLLSREFKTSAGPSR